MSTVTHTGVQIRTEPLGGSPLSRLAQAGTAPAAWYPPRPASPDEWAARARQVRATAEDGWEQVIAAAGAPRGPAAERIARVAREGGVLVTTGQQPGLFGGPAYTWSKAIGALAFADALEAATGIAVAPLFWAATDDADFLEASWTMVSMSGGAVRLSMPGKPTEGIRMSDVPVGDLSEQLAQLEEACGSVADVRALDGVRSAYLPRATVGGAYVHLLRTLLEPLGVTVLDAANAAVSQAAHPCLIQALEHREALRGALHARAADISAAGFAPQVSEVEGRTLVFHRDGARRERVAHELAMDIINKSTPGELAPNVLLRPVVERALLPTVAYVAGPGEIAYFAQVSAVAGILRRPAPLAVPRWSMTFIEPNVAALLERHRLSPESFADPHAVETEAARSAWPPEVQGEFARLRAAVGERTESLRRAVDAAHLVTPTVVDGLKRGIDWRLGRLERRLTAAVKRREGDTMHDLATLRGALQPDGMRQERSINLVPTLARHGLGVLEQMREAALTHAHGLVGG